MAIMDYKQIIERVRAASPESPIAVFRTPDRKLEAVFGSTIETQKRIERARRREFVGLFHNQMPGEKVADTLMRASWY